MASPRDRGLAFEGMAAAYLEGQGLTIIERNWRCPGGEIDIIAQDGVMLVFVEVRARQSMAFGGALISIDRGKQARLRASAERYLQRLRHVPPCRFDVVAIEPGGRMHWLRAAISHSDE